MLCFVVVATKRADWTEAIISVNRSLEDAQRLGQRVAAAMSQKFIRCRIRQMDLTRTQAEAICHEWGRSDALDGEPLLANKLPKLYAAAYRRGYRVGNGRKDDDGGQLPRSA